MRHHSNVKKFRRTRTVRKAFMSSLAEALIMRERILTTETRAKSLKSFVEPLVTKARTPSLAMRRNLISSLQGREKVAKKLIDVIAPRYSSRTGGYTRITKVAKRASDGRSHAVIEFI